jgi:hypothetical protein
MADEPIVLTPWNPSWDESSPPPVPPAEAPAEVRAGGGTGDLYDEQGSLMVTIRPPKDANVDIDFTEADFGGTSGFTPVKFAEKEMNDTFERWGASTPAVLAHRVVDDISGQEGTEGLMTVEGLRDGTAPYFDLNPATSDLRPDQRKLDFSGIVREFSNAEDRSYFEQLALEAPRVALGLTGAAAGAQLSKYPARLVAKVPVVGPYAAPVVLGAGTLTGMILGGDFLGNFAKEQLLGDVPPYTPRSRLNVVRGEETANVLEGIGGLELLKRSLAKKARKSAGGGVDVPDTGYNPDVGLAGVAMMKGINDIATNPNIPRSLKFLRGFENIVGKTAATAAARPGATYTVEAALGVTSLGGATYAEKTDPGDTTRRAIYSGVAPIAASTLWAVSPSRLILSRVYQALTPVLGKKGAALAELDRGVPKYEAAKAQDPDAKPEDFNLKETAGGTYELIEAPGFMKRLRDVPRSIASRRKQQGAQVLVDDFYKTMSEAGEDPKAIEAALNGIIERFARGDVRPLFTEPSFAKMRQMLERQGIDFSAQGKAAGKAAESDVANELDTVTGIIQAGMMSGSREGYLLASTLAQKAFEGGMAEDVAARAGKVFSAYKQVMGGDQFDANTASEAMFRAIDPLIEATSDTASNLYKRFPEHRILFGDDTPIPVKALDESDIIPKDPRVREMLPEGLRKIIKYVEDVRADHTDFLQGRPAIGDLVRNDKALQNAEQKFSKTLADSEGPTADTFRKKIADIDLDSDDAVGNINKIITDGYEGRYGAKGAAATRTKNLLKQQVALLNERKAAVTRATEAASAAPAPDGGMDAQTLKEFRTELLDIVRDPNTTGRNKERAGELADAFERQILDENAQRDLSTEELANFIPDRLAANAYYRARQNIFNDGIFAEIKKTTKQGAPKSVEVLREKMKALGSPTGAYIADLQRASRFTMEPVGAPTLRPGASAAKKDVDLRPFESQILSGMVRPAGAPPSAQALEHRILNEVESLITANQQIPGTGRAVVDPSDVEDVTEASKELGITLAESNAIQKVLDNSQNNGLDLLPNLKENLENLLTEGKSYTAFQKTVVEARKKYADQNLWHAMASGGRDADFVTIIGKAYTAANRAKTGVRPVFDNLLEPIRIMDKKSRENPREFLKALQQEELFDGAAGININNLSDIGVKRLLIQARQSAQRGLKELVLDYAKTASGAERKSGVDYNELRRTLFEAPRVPGAQVRMPSLVDWMQKSGLMTSDQAKNLRTSLNNYAAFSEELAKNYPDVFEGTNPIAKATARVFGSAVGGGLHKTLQRITGGFLGGTGGITAAGAGAGAAQSVLINARAAATQDGIIKLMQDNPAEIARLLRLTKKGVDPKSNFSLGDGRTFINLLTQMQLINVPRAGAIRVQQEAEPSRDRTPVEPAPALKRRLDPYEEKPPIGDQSSLYGQRFSRQLKVAQAPKPAPFLELIAQAAQPAQAPANAPRPAGQPNPEMRQRMAAAFPEDRDLMSGGIASMMG